MAKGLERRQEIGKFIPVTAIALPVVAFTEGAENLQDTAPFLSAVRVAVT